MNTTTNQDKGSTTNDSWIAPLLRQFGNACFTIAPERRPELAEIMGKVEYKVDCVTPKWIFEGGNGWTGSGIDISQSALESLWMLSYATMAVYRQFEASGFENSVKPDAKTIEITELACKRIKTAAHWELPTDSPRPADEQRNEAVRLANWLFIGSAGFGVLHEVGHIVRRHPTSQEISTEDKFRHEFEADEWANDWIMQKWDGGSNEAMKRNVFVAGLFTLLAARALCLTAPVDKLSHPNVIERLLRFFQKHNQSNEISWESAWNLPAHVIPFFMKINGITPPNQKVEKPSEALELYRPYFERKENVAV